MTESEVVNTPATISSRMHFPNEGSWESISNDEKDTRWSDELVGIVLALLGNNEVIYATGAAVPSIPTDSATIEITIISAASVILADFRVGSTANDPTSWRVLRNDVRAHSRTAISRVHVEPAPISPKTSRSKPGQVAATLFVADTRRRLPAAKDQDYDPELAAALTDLVRRW